MTIDGEFPAGEWDDAAAYFERFEEAGLDMAIAAGITPDGLHMRIDSSDVLGGTVGFDLYLASAVDGTVRSTTLGGNLLGFGATNLYRWSTADPGALLIADAMPGIWSNEATFTEMHPTGSGAVGDGFALEFTIPISDLGPIEAGDLVRFRLVPWDDGEESILLPADAPGGRPGARHLQRRRVPGYRRSSRRRPRAGYATRIPSTPSSPAGRTTSPTCRSAPRATTSSSPSRYWPPS